MEHDATAARSWRNCPGRPARSDRRRHASAFSTNHCTGWDVDGRHRPGPESPPRWRRSAARHSGTPAGQLQPGLADVGRPALASLAPPGAAGPGWTPRRVRRTTPQAQATAVQREKELAGEPGESCDIADGSAEGRRKPPAHPARLSGRPCGTTVIAAPTDQVAQRSGLRWNSPAPRAQFPLRRPARASALTDRWVPPAPDNLKSGRQQGRQRTFANHRHRPRRPAGQ